MTVPSLGWQAHVSDDAHNWAADTYGVTLYQRTGDGGMQIVGFDDAGWPVIEGIEPGALPKPAFRIPREAVHALAEAVKPGPSQAEVRRLEEALAIERVRVDRWIEQGPPALHHVAPTDRGADVVALILSERAAEFVRSVLVAFDGPESGKKLAAEVVGAIDGRPR